ncbi:MAG: choice-of-anchor D domain-containing protein [Bacteroidota bacterium]
MRRLLSSLLLSLIMFPGLVFSQWESAHGPEGGTVNVLFEDGGNLYSGTASGIFRSTDAGATWKSVLGGIGPSGVYSFISHGGALFAGNASPHVMRSTDGGLTWTETSSENGSQVFNFISKGSALYAGSLWSGIWRTTDLGQTWEERNTGLPLNRSMTFFRTGSAFVVGMPGGGLYRSTDDGGNWTDISAAIPDGEVRAACEHAGAVYVYIVGFGIYKSTNQGITWNPTAASGVYSGLYSDGTRLYAIASDRLWFTDDGGASWTDRALMPNSQSGLCLIKSGGRLLIGHDATGVTASTDEGLTWAASSRGLSASRVTAVLKSGQNLFAGSASDGLHRSTDGGTQWTKLQVAQYFYNAQALAEKSNVIFCGSNVGVVYSTDAGDNWQIASGSGGYSITALAATSSVMYAATSQGQVLASTDNGVTWTLRGDLGTGDDINAIVDNGSVVMASTSGDGMFVSTDGGATWTVRNNGIGGFPSSQDLLLINGVWYFASTEGLYLSGDNGLNWILKENTLRGASSTAMVAVDGGILVGDYGDAVFFYDIKDTLWTRISEGYGGTVVNDLAENNGTVILGSYANGVWTREVNELTPAPGITINPPALDFGEIAAGTTLKKTASVENNSDGTVRLRTYAVTGPDAASFSLIMPQANILHVGEFANFDITFAPTAGRTYSAELVITSNDVSTPEHRIALSGKGQKAPEIAVDRPKITFPGTEVGSMRAELLTIENRGGEDLEISETSLTGSGSAVYFVRDGGSMIIAAGTSKEVSVEFTPAAAIPYSATLTIRSNDPGVPAYPVTLTGLGTSRAEPNIELDRAAISFGSANVGSSISENLTIRNIGTTALSITGYRFQEIGAGEFALQSGSPGTIQPSQQMMISLAFAPTKAGVHTATFIITSDDPDTPNAFVSLTGNAVVSSVSDIDAAPRTLLLQNHPNPAAGTTVIPFQLQQSSHVRLELFDLLGRPLQLLRDEVLPEGSHSLRLNTTALPAGVYIYKLSTDREVLTRRFVVTSP